MLFSCLQDLHLEVYSDNSLQFKMNNFHNNKGGIINNSFCHLYLNPDLMLTKNTFIQTDFYLIFFLVFKSEIHSIFG